MKLNITATDKSKNQHFNYSLELSSKQVQNTTLDLNYLRHSLVRYSFQILFKEPKISLILLSLYPQI